MQNPQFGPSSFSTRTLCIFKHPHEKKNNNPISTYLRGIVIVRRTPANFHTVSAVKVFSTTITVNGTTNTSIVSR